MVTIEGRGFPDELLLRVNQAVEAEPQLSRRQLSLRVCDWMDWRNTAGRPQEMSCRKALLKLERSGAIRLPAVTKRFPFETKRAPMAPPPIAAIECPFEELGAVQLVRVSSRSQSRLWRSMMDAHHYLKGGQLCGAQMRYLVRSERHGWLGGLSFSACARRVEARDMWIGWTEEARERNHIYLVNNTRFLIAPSVKVKNLASYVLARCSRRLADDWEEEYDYRPVLLETYVERDRFSGVCYRAANWLRIGKTGGRGRRGTGATVKDIYVMPLKAAWQSTLCRRPDGTITVRRAEEPPPPRDWIEAEFGGAEMGDRRLTARLLQMTGMFYDNPTGSIPEQCGSAAGAKAAYRFLDNEAVGWQDILDPHIASTGERLRDEEVVLAVQDTTTLNYTSHPCTQGLGPIGSGEGGPAAVGLVVHDTMVFTPQGTPLGLADVQCWARDGFGHRDVRHQTPIEEKESRKWLESYRAVAALRQCAPRTRVVVVADREADIHDVFAEGANTPGGPDLLIRAERSRKRRILDDAENCEPLWSALELQPVLGTREILVAPQKGRAGRQARLAVRSMPVTLRPPKSKKRLGPVRAWAVYAREVEPPDGVEGLEWMLLTTVPTEGVRAACERLEWYERRWGIEVYHRILKSGCRVEARQLQNAHRLRNGLAIYMVVAWRIYHLTEQGRQTPDVPCTVYFTDAEWKALTTFTAKTKSPPKAPPSLHEAVALLGVLGGHLGRTGDGNPGVEVLWRGTARLADLAAAYALYH